MSELRIRIKLGDHEVEIEGAAAAVERQVETFKQLLIAPAGGPASESATSASTPAVPPLPLETILAGHGSIYSLRAPTAVPDAILVILLGQRVYRRNNNVSGLEIMRGLRASRIHVARVDHILMRFIRFGWIVFSGRNRGRRYALTAAGLESAERIARALAAATAAGPPPEAKAAASGGGSREARESGSG